MFSSPSPIPLLLFTGASLSRVFSQTLLSDTLNGRLEEAYPLMILRAPSPAVSRFAPLHTLILSQVPSSPRPIALTPTLQPHSSAALLTYSPYVQYVCLLRRGEAVLCFCGQSSVKRTLRVLQDRPRPPPRSSRAVI